MEAPTETPPDAQINSSDSPNNDTSHLSDRDDLDADLQSQSAATEQTLVILQREGDVVADLTKLVDEISRERDSLRDKVDEFEASLKEKENEFAKKLDEELRKTEELKSEVEVSRERIKKSETEIKERNGLLLDLLQVSRETLKRIMESVDVDEEEKAESTSVGEEEEDEEEIAETRRVAREAEEKVREFKEKRRKEKRELEKSVVSLTEENRDINSLLRAALVEKEAVEKSLSKLKGNNSNEQKRVALLQIAERGLQRVGFGFMMGTTGTTTTTTTTSSGEQQTQTSSDTSECEEEEINVSLVCYFVVYMICNI